MAKMNDHTYRGYYTYTDRTLKPWTAFMTPNYKGPYIKRSFFTQRGCVAFLLRHNVVYEGLRGEGPSK